MGCPSDSTVAIDPHEQAWRRLISHTTPRDELPFLIETIFSGMRTTNIAGHLPGNDIQAFIDTIDEVRRHTPRFQGIR